MPGSGSPVACGLDKAATGFLTTYTYSLAGHSMITNSGGQARGFWTDSLGRQTSVQEPEMFTGDPNTVTSYGYSYNSTGLVVTRTRPRANQTSPDVTTTTTTQYDTLGRAIAVQYNDGTTPSKGYLYDAPGNPWAEAGSQTYVKGRLSLAIGDTNRTGTLFSYDATGRTTAMWECQPSGCGNAARDRGLGFGYDYAGRLTSEADPTTGTVNYSYSPANEVTSVWNTAYNDAYNPGTYVSSVVNGPLGPTSYHLGNSLNEVITYEAAGQVEGKWLCSASTANYCSGGTQIYGVASEWRGPYLNNGIDTVMNTGGPYTYDEFGRLKSFTSNVGQPSSFTWTYDRWGNRWSQTPGDSVTFNAGMNHKLDGSTVYDAAGNIIQDVAHHYTYDAEGNLLNVDSGQTASYIYDALNQRVQINVPTASPSTLEFTYDFAGRRITTWDAAADFGIQGQAWWGNMPLAYRGVHGYTYFQQSDWQGTQRMLTNYAGTVLSRYYSNPFGDGYSAGGQDDNRLHYALTEHDAESGTDHAQYRQYDTSVGNWMSMDPYAGSYDWSNPQSLNRYSYVGNNPNSFSDPTGQIAEGPALYVGTAICGPECGLIAAIGVGVGELLEGLFGFNAPSFHGTLQPRPSDPLDDHLGVGNYKFPNPGIAGALGLPDNGCEFGSCGGGSLGFQNGATTAPAPFDWCGADSSVCLPGLWALLRSIPVAAASVVTLSMTGDNSGCIPAAGTQCHQEHIGHPHNGWDPHYHIWTRNQNPSTGQCFWNRGGGTSGATQFPPTGMQECGVYPTWPTL
jgi:RHS repeat-associated protein